MRTLLLCCFSLAVLNCASAEVQVVDKMSSLDARKLGGEITQVHVTVSGAGWTYGGYDLAGIITSVAGRGYEPTACDYPGEAELQIQLAFEDGAVQDTVRVQTGVITNAYGMIIGGEWSERLIDRANSGFGVVRATLSRGDKKLFTADARYEHPDFNKVSISDAVDAVLGKIPDGRAKISPERATQVATAAFAIQDGIAAFEKKDYAQAAAKLAEAEKTEPSCPTVRLWRSVALRQDRKLEPAVAEVEQALKLDPKSAYAYDARGWLRLDRDQAKTALEDFNKELAINNNLVRGWKGKGAALDRLGDEAASAEAFDRAVKLAPSDPGSWIGLGWTRYHTGAITVARDAFEHSIQLDPDRPAAHDGRGWCELDVGEAVAAEKDFDIAIEGTHDLGRPYRGLGLSQLALGNAKAAVDSLKRAMQLDPRSVRGWVGLGQASARIDEHSAAVDAFDKALEIEPKNLDALKGRAGEHLAQQNLPPALEDVNGALALSANDPELYELRSKIKFALSSSEAADADFRKAESIRSERESQALTAQLANKDEDAQHLYRKALSRFPTLTGEAKLRVTVAADGSVINAELVSSSLDNLELQDQLVAQAKGWSFPRKTAQPMTVEGAFHFAPPDAHAAAH